MHGEAITPLPGPIVGIDEYLKALQHAVVGQRVGRLFRIAGQLVRLNAAEDGNAEIRDEDGAASGTGARYCITV